MGYAAGRPLDPSEKATVRQLFFTRTDGHTEPVQLQLLEGFSACNRAAEPVGGRGHGASADCVMM